ncbi:MAG: hypothetical protein HPY74_04475 [Firmicutes bacterium]|nr:hypothetical protein [Bacillota bacterium]
MISNSWNGFYGIIKEWAWRKRADNLRSFFCAERRSSDERTGLKQKLLRFQNPPEVVRDQWLNEQGTALDEERGHVLCTLADTRDAEQDYELGEAFREPGQDEGVRMC